MLGLQPPSLRGSPCPSRTHVRSSGRPPARRTAWHSFSQRELQVRRFRQARVGIPGGHPLTCLKGIMKISPAINDDWPFQAQPGFTF